ncbi:MAG: radical SAM family heme chaperone HemW [candidate division Zixibacteria bacterium]|nr:radical SAM family heme chaperone HemW [candidate division Zixibacteria bacterium]
MRQNPKSKSSPESKTRSFPSEDSLSIYVHYPFCSKLCGYCDFHKSVLDRRREKIFLEALLIDTELAADELRSAYKNRIPEITTLYIGGGTPSLIDLKLFEKWIEIVRRRFKLSDNLEFTIELNPESTTKENLEVFRQAGVNRLSIGVQSFDSESLKLLDRRHRIIDTHRAVYLARAMGFENYSVDLIFGLPGQTPAKLQDDLEELLELEPNHVSFYQLTVKEQTPLESKIKSGEIKLPDDDEMAIFYETGCQFLAEEGFERYEISSFARKGKRSRHNQRYWESKPCLALGPSAHGFDGQKRYSLIADTGEYIETLTNDHRRPLIWDENTLQNRMTEHIMLGLRTTAGIDRKVFNERFGRSDSELFDQDEFARLVEIGYLIPSGGKLCLSDKGLNMADEITHRLLAD